MKRILLVTFIGLALVSFLAIEAQCEVLPVYDDDGQEVPEGIASALGLDPKENVSRTSVKVLAQVNGSLLGVSLSATEINWDIDKQGNYMTPAIEIDREGSVSAINMDVEGAEDLWSPNDFGPGGQPILRELPTGYHLRAEDTVPSPDEFVDAVDFNGTHLIEELHTTLWNRLEVTHCDADTCPPDGKVVAGEYSDRFWVTFSAAL